MDGYALKERWKDEEIRELRGAWYDSKSEATDNVEEVEEVEEPEKLDADSIKVKNVKVVSFDMAFDALETKNGG